jgi:hypothetical protein
MNKETNMLESKIVDRVLKESSVYKQAKIFAVGDAVTLVDQVQGLNKGSIYKVVDCSNDGKITIANFLPEQNEEGEVIGEFPVDRFVKYNYES